MGLRKWILKKTGFNFKTFSYLNIKSERFESLGNNCELGLFLNELGNSESSFFRYTFISNYSLVNNLIRNEFKDVFLLENLERINESMIYEKKYGISYHSKLKIINREDILKNLTLNENQANESYQKELEKIRYLANKFIKNLKNNKKIYVIKKNDNSGFDEISLLSETLNLFGKCVVLNVISTNDLKKISTVEKINDFLYVGYIRKFAPYEKANDFSFKEWYKLLKNADKNIVI